MPDSNDRFIQIYVSAKAYVEDAFAGVRAWRRDRKASTTRSDWPALMRLSIHNLYTLQFGGPLDALAMTSIAVSVVVTTPVLAFGLASSYGLMLPFLAGGFGAAVLTWRAIEPWRRAHILSSSLQLKSSPSPYTPEEGKEWDGLLVGYACDSGKPVYIDYEHLTRHVGITGGSGVGKTVAASTLMFQHIQKGGGLLFIDGKLDADNLTLLASFAKYCGREHDVLVINPDDPANSNTYNPILVGDPDEKADGILNLIPSTENNPGADHYKQEAKQSLTTLIAALQKAKLAYNMIDLTVLLMSGKALEELERTLKMHYPESEEAKNFSLFLDKFRAPLSDRNAPGAIMVEKLKNTFGGIGGRLYTFGTGSFGKVMNTYQPDVNLFDAITTNKIVYVALPTMHKDMSARNFGRLTIADLRTAIGKIQKLPKDDRPDPPFWIFCDEAGSYVTDSFSRLLEQSRSARCFFALATQTNSNFQAISDELYNMVIGNSWTKIVFKVGSQMTATEAADLIGMKVGVLKSLTTSRSRGVSAAFLSPSPEHGTSNNSGQNAAERQQETYIISPDDLKRLDKGECVMTTSASGTGNLVFNLRVPMLSFTRETRARLGPVRINRFRTSGIKIDGARWSGANFFRNVDRYLTTTQLDEVRQREKAGDGADKKRTDKRRPQSIYEDESSDAQET